MVGCCIGLNFYIAILSFIALIVIVKRRCEAFSLSSLLILICTSTCIGSAQTFSVTAGLKFGGSDGSSGYIGGNLVVLVLISYSSIPLYATFHQIYALQYLRAGLTVPLIFQRKIREDSNFAELLPSIDQKIRKRKMIIVIMQTVTFIAGIVFVILETLNWTLSVDDWG